MKDGRPLRLAFSGRLIRMKGADHLPLVARELKRRQVPFELTICGDGALADGLRQQIRSFGLEDCVRMRGVLDFANELMPFVKQEVDAFVCCHRQGDPSCTYIETMSCGVPVVGYENEALAGLLRRVPAGVGVPMDDVSSLANALARLHADRPSLATMSRRAGLCFAKYLRGDRPQADGASAGAALVETCFA